VRENFKKAISAIPIIYYFGSQRVIPGPAALAPPKLLLEIHILRSHLRALSQKLWEMGPAISV
jgi:hypothetical protein